MTEIRIGSVVAGDGHPTVVIAEAADDEAATAAALSVASRGNVKTETMRAFSAAEMTKILDEKSSGLLTALSAKSRRWPS